LVPAFRLEYEWEDETPNEYVVGEGGGNGGYLQNDPIISHPTSTKASKKDDLYDDARRLSNEKFNVEDPAMSAMQGSILTEQRNELAALKDDSAFEDSAMASLQADEHKMESDERKVDEDRKRKFGKHKKRWKDEGDTKKDDNPDVYTKIRDFTDSLGLSDRKRKDDANDSSNERERRDEMPDSDELADFDENMLRDFASGKNSHKHFGVHERYSPQSPSEILGNIAQIFENVNKKNEALVRKKKHSILRSNSRNEDENEYDENENEEFTNRKSKHDLIVGKRKEKQRNKVK
jgi:hypothetical protein